MMTTQSTHPAVNIDQRLLRCVHTELYWQNGRWTHNPYEATVFSDVYEAVKIACEQHLEKVEVVLPPPPPACRPRLPAR